MCKVCEHPKRREIDAAILGGEPANKIAKLFELSRTTLNRHRESDHARTVPYDCAPKKRSTFDPIAGPSVSVDSTGPEPEPNPWPTNAEIAQIKDQRKRSDLLFRYFGERRWRGGKTVALLAHLWRKSLGDRAEEQIAEMASNAALRAQRLRGPRHLRREELIGRANVLAEKAERSGKYADALACLKFVAELDGLTYEPGVLSALVEAQAWRLIRPLIEREAPHLLEKIDRTLTGAERKRQKAIRTIEQGPNPEELEGAEPALPPHEERLREEVEGEPLRCEWEGCGANAEVAPERRNGTTWDVCARHAAEGRERDYWKEEDEEALAEPPPPNDDQTFAAPRNLGGRRPRAKPPGDPAKDEGSAEG